MTVRPWRTNSSWVGAMPSPSSSSRRAATFIEAPKSCEKVTRKRPWFWYQKVVRVFLHDGGFGGEYG